MKDGRYLHVAVALLGQSAKELMSVIRILDAFILGAGTGAEPCSTRVRTCVTRVME